MRAIVDDIATYHLPVSNQKLFASLLLLLFRYSYDVNSPLQSVERYALYSDDCLHWRRAPTSLDVPLC